MRYTKEARSVIEKYRGDLITIHNHPESMPPSSDDFDCNFQHGYLYGLTVGHNGNVFKYSSDMRVGRYFYSSYAVETHKPYLDEIENIKNAIALMAAENADIKCEEAMTGE